MVSWDIIPALPGVTEQNHKNFSQNSRLEAEIWTQDLPNTKQEY
jgi:hypothetical protein